MGGIYILLIIRVFPHSGFSAPRGNRRVYKTVIDEVLTDDLCVYTYTDGERKRDRERVSERMDEGSKNK